MSRSSTLPLSVGAPAAPETLSLLHRRLMLAEEEAEALVQDMGALGVSRDQILGSTQRMDASQRPVSPLKMHRVPGAEGMLWQQCDSLVSRVCRMESLLQTLKLTIFRLETERELDPSHTAHLKQQLAALQQESEEEQQVSRWEVMKLRDKLQQAYQERDEARTEVQRLGETLEVATAAKMDVAFAAEELKIVKLEMSQKLMEMKEQMRQESGRSVEAMKSHCELLQRVEEMETVVDTERRQALLLQSDCQAIHVQVQTSRQQLEEEKDRGRQLEEHRRQLKEQTAMKDSLVSELKTELKSVCLALQRQQTENSKLLMEGRELRSAADRVQTLNKQLESQCSQLSSALRSLSVENEEQQANLMGERRLVVKELQERDLLLESARHNIHTELQVALTDKFSLQLELEKLKGEHVQLLQSSSIAQETTVTQRELLERTIQRLRGELSRATKEEGAMRKDLEGSKNELRLVVTKLEDERSSLETQLSEAKWEVRSLSSALQSQQDENRRLMGKHSVQRVDKMLKDLTDKNMQDHEKGKLKISELEALQGVCGPTGGIGQTLESILASQTRLQLNSQTLQQELGGRDQEPSTLKKDRLQAQREIRKHQVEVEKLQRLLTSTHSKSNRALESLQKASDTAKVDNKRLAQSLEQSVLTNSSLHRKLEQARDQYQAAITLRDKELCEARIKISHLSEALGAVKQQTREDYESSMKMHREISEEKELTDSKPPEVRMDCQQVLRKREAEWERWTSTIRRWEAKRELAHIAGGSKPVRTQLTTQSH
ncbi:coiled-coil domain-containing protein 150-like isoform X2 [Sebastes fasciatus]|uniref:coiled-coil domain-containing protein 150-like isoform X2 n=1 Tax=Sebastes fasciatus TaxID=394691 RepID=UPI003D9EF6AE